MPIKKLMFLDLNGNKLKIINKNNFRLKNFSYICVYINNLKLKQWKQKKIT